MLVKKWEKLPQSMQTDAVRPYYDRLRKKISVCSGNDVLIFSCPQ